MKKLVLKIRSEEGASSIVEAIIVYPIVLIAVVFLLVLGFTYVQEGYLNHKSQSISDYLAKSIVYPGYSYIEKPEYMKEAEAITIGDINAAMKAQAPYRYMFGIFGAETSVKDSSGGDLAENYAKFMANDYLSKHGFLKAYSGEIDFYDAFKESEWVLFSQGDNISSLKQNKPNTLVTNAEGGYLCAIRATTSQVEVFMAQNYVFARFFRMIGMGNKKITISAKGISAVSDSLEIVKTTDMATDMITFLAQRLGFDISKVKTLREIIQGNN